jgi:apolipoprotein N-acyltransferase
VSSIRDRTRVASILFAVAAAAAVPFVATGLFRLSAPTAVVALLLLASAAALAAVPRHGRWLAAGWLFGVVLYTAFLLWLFDTFATPPGF